MAPGSEACPLLPAPETIGRSRAGAALHRRRGPRNWLDHRPALLLPGVKQVMARCAIDHPTSMSEDQPEDHDADERADQ